MDVHEVMVPGAIITTHKNRSLLSIGNTSQPFSIVCLCSHLFVFSPVTWQFLVHLEGGLDSETQTRAAQAQSSQTTGMDDEETILSNSQPGPSIGDIVTETSNSADLPQILPGYPHVIDEASLAKGNKALRTNPDIWDGRV